jgi:hypothetical protein
MRRIAILSFVLIAHFSYADACKYGLGYATYSTDSCSSRETEALRRVAAAKTICTSGNSEVQWNKNNKEPSWAWAALRAGEFAAVKDFSFQACEHADLVVKYVYDDTSERVTINVTDAESSATVYEESRSVSDLRSDAVRMANHWHEMVVDARAAAHAAKAAAEEAEREREREAKLEEKSRQCQVEFDALKQDIIAYVEVQHVPLPQIILNQIAAHNGRCTNTVSPEIVEQQEKANADAKLAQEKAAKEKALQEQRAAELEKEKVDALTAWQQQVSSAPFVPPTEGWAHATPQPNAPSYIILPRTGQTAECHFSWDRSKPVLDCLGAVGRNDYFSVQSNGRWYLLKSKWTGSGDYAATVKDGGSTICLRKAGCYHVLAEIRPQPTELPDKLQVPTPGSLTMAYEKDDFSFIYPQNWRAEEKNNKAGVLLSVNVAPSEAHLASWITHGVLIGHVTKMSSKFPQTLDGAYDQFTTFQRQRGFVVTDPKTVVSVGDSQGKIALYTSPSVFNAGEYGWIVVVKDKSDGYYWVLMFCPANDDTRLYAQTFGEILKSFKFKK